MNRLKLDWSLSTKNERKSFLDRYLTEKQFIEKPPTNDELEQMGDYLLYGKNDNGLNDVQEKDIFIATKHGTWDRPQEESYEALIEAPGFTETSMRGLYETSYKKSRETFSREKVLAQSDGRIKQLFLDLFARIDLLDLKLNIYELNHGKRDEIRKSLTDKFDEQEYAAACGCTESWTPYQYLKYRHELVELRREQYTLRDSISEPCVAHSEFKPIEQPQTCQWDSDVNVLPLGLKTNNTALVFAEKDLLNPDHYSDDQLKIISDYYWKMRKREKTQNEFDFTNLEHVYQLFTKYFDLEDAAAASSEDVESNSLSLLNTLKYYVEFAELNELQSEILNAKMQGRRNSDIVYDINKKYDKNYTPNYISTIFRQKIIPLINNAASEHEKIVSNLFFPEEFKTCCSCGRTFLRNADYFVRKARSSDGLNSRCKICDRVERNLKKEIKYGNN